MSFILKKVTLKQLKNFVLPPKYHLTVSIYILQAPLEKWMEHCIEIIFCKVMHGYLVLSKLTWVI